MRELGGRKTYYPFSHPLHSSWYGFIYPSPNLPLLTFLPFLPFVYLSPQSCFLILSFFYSFCVYFIYIFSFSLCYFLCKFFPLIVFPPFLKLISSFFSVFRLLYIKFIFIGFLSFHFPHFFYFFAFLFPALSLLLPSFH